MSTEETYTKEQKEYIRAKRMFLHNESHSEGVGKRSLAWLDSAVDLRKAEDELIAYAINKIPLTHDEREELAIASRVSIHHREKIISLATAANFFAIGIAVAHGGNRK